MSILTGQEAQSSLSLEPLQPCRRFTFSEIQIATRNFDESLVIGSGGFGKVYKGTITNGESLLDAAIKRLGATSNQGAVEFWAEIEMLSKLRHCHLMSLIGYCNDGQEMILVYQYMPHGTLAHHLHKSRFPLSWVRRLKICIGAARGLHYLHTGTGIRHGVIHRDVKSSNILLDDCWEAKISDFGLSKIGPTNQPCTSVSTLVKGTFGYLDPDYVFTGRLTRKSDVYAFGVVLFEVLCGKQAVDRSIDEEQWGLARWAQDSIQKGMLKHIVDTNLRGRISPKCLKKFARLADWCLQSHLKQRPTMAEVVVGLESVLALQEKSNNTLQPAGMTIFGRQVPKLIFPSNREHSGPASMESKSTHSCHSSLPSDRCRRFSLTEVKAATREFNDECIIGHGGFGKVYKGYIDNGTTTVAIKRLNSSSSQGPREFHTEIGMQSKLRHVHLVSLIGYCDDDEEMVLVYDYMAHGTLREHLYMSNNPPLSWKRRLYICIGAARGLHYLHTSAERRIIHRDVKSTNILLDDNWVAKVSDFSLSKLGPNDPLQTHVSTVVKGSFGYLDPEYFRRQQLTYKSDVYSFGVVLLEVLCARPVMIPGLAKKQVSLAEWGKYCYQKGILDQIIDGKLRDEIAPECLMKFGEVANSCLKEQGCDRLTMEEVVYKLELALEVQETAEKTGGGVVSENQELPFLRHGEATTTDDDVFSGSSAIRNETSSISTTYEGFKSETVFSEMGKPTGR